MAVSSILNFSKYLTFDLDDIEGRVISLFKGFPFFLDTVSNSKSNKRSKVKFTCTTFSISQYSRCMYILRQFNICEFEFIYQPFRYACIFITKK